MILNLPLKKISFWGLNPPKKRQQRSRFSAWRELFRFIFEADFPASPCREVFEHPGMSYFPPPLIKLHLSTDWKHNSLLWSLMNLCSSSVIKYSWFKTHFIPTQITHVKEIGGFIRFLLFAPFSLHSRSSACFTSQSITGDCDRFRGRHTEGRRRRTGRTGTFI